VENGKYSKSGSGKDSVEQIRKKGNAIGFGREGFQKGNRLTEEGKREEEEKWKEERFLGGTLRG